MKSNLVIFIICLIGFSISLKSSSQSRSQNALTNQTLEAKLNLLYQQFKTHLDDKTKPPKEKSFLLTNFSKEANILLNDSLNNNFTKSTENPILVSFRQKDNLTPFSWTLLPPINNSPLVRRGHSVIQTDTFLILFGGCNINGECFNDVNFFNFLTNQWYNIAPKGKIPSPRQGHSSVLYGNKMIIYGGSSNDGYKDDLFEFNLETKVWTMLEFKNKLKTGRTGHGAAIDNNGQMFIFGGYTDKGYSNELFIIDLVNQQFNFDISTMGLAPSPRESFVFQSINNKIVLFGGFHEGGVLNDLYFLNLTSLAWETIKPITPSPPPMAGMASTVIGNKIYITGGCDYRSRKCGSSTFIFDTDALSWTTIRLTNEIDIYPSRGEFSLNFFRGNLVIFGGCDMYIECYSDIYVMNITNKCPFNCSNNGICNEKVGCVCNEGFFGGDCGKKVKCLNDCGGNGICGTNGICRCDKGFKGKGCEINVHCVNNCTDENHGICDYENELCVCKEGFSGIDCSASSIIQQEAGGILIEVNKKITGHKLKRTNDNEGDSKDEGKDDNAGEDQSEEGDNKKEDSNEKTEEEKEEENGESSEGESKEENSSEGEEDDDNEEKKTFVLKITNETISTTKGCLNGCSSHGLCLNKICYCEQEYAGDDCSIPINEFKDTGYFLKLVYPYFIYLAVAMMVVALGYNIIKLFLKSKEDFLELSSKEDEINSNPNLNTNNTLIPNP